MSKKASSAEVKAIKTEKTTKETVTRPGMELSTESLQQRIVENWREMRFISLGAISVAAREVRDLVEKARHQVSDTEAKTSEDADAQAALQKAYLRLNNQIQSGWSFMRAMEKTLEDGGRKWLEKINSAATVEAGESAESGARMQQKAQALWQELKGQWNELRRDMESSGRDRDLELRRVLRGRIEDLSRRSEQLLQQMGLVTKAEMESLNRKIMGLSEMLKAQIDQEETVPLIMNRRGQDRRKRNQKVGYERRLYFRRAEDRSKVA